MLAPNDDQRSIIHLDAQQPQYTYTFNLNQEFILQLPENRTTGFRWYIQTSGMPVCVFQKDLYDGGSVHMPGQGGLHYWYFQTQQIGTGDIVFVYRRPWEQDSTNSHTITVHIQVHKQE